MRVSFLLLLIKLGENVLHDIVDDENFVRIPDYVGFARGHRRIRSNLDPVFRVQHVEHAHVATLQAHPGVPVARDLVVHVIRVTDRGGEGHRLLPSQVGDAKHVPIAISLMGLGAVAERAALAAFPEDDAGVCQAGDQQRAAIASFGIRAQALPPALLKLATAANESWRWLSSPAFWILFTEGDDLCEFEVDAIVANDMCDKKRATF
jgi:hypothetical protein